MRLDHHRSERQRIFTRYTYLRDEDTPVTPLPDGSGSLTAGVIGHAINRADGVVGEYEWTPAPSMLNQARIGYSRRTLAQNALTSGDLGIPGIPAKLPTFLLPGYQQIGPTAGADSDFATSVTEFVDTYSWVRHAHTLRFGADLRREAAGVLSPQNPAGVFQFLKLADLLQGRVNAFPIDIQQHTIQERAHIAEFFAGDDWKVSERLTLNLGTRYTINFPSTIEGDQGGVFNLNTQVLDFPHTARELHLDNFGPRAGLALRLGESLVLRAGYGMIWFEQTGITTPFTIPQFPLIQTVGEQSQNNVNPAFLLAAGPSVQVTPPNPNSGLGQGVFGVDRANGSGYSQQRNLTLQKTFGKDLNAELGYLGSKNTRLGIPDANINQLPARDLALGASLLAKVANPYYGQIPASSSLGGPTIARQQLLRPFPRFTTVALFRDNVGNSSYNAFAAKFEKRLSGGLTVSHRAGAEQQRPGRRLTAIWRRTSRAATSRRCSRPHGRTVSRAGGGSRAGRSPGWCGCSRATPYRSPRRRTSIRTSASRSSVRTGSPTRTRYRGGPVHHWQQLAQPGAGPGPRKRRSDVRENLPSP